MYVRLPHTALAAHALQKDETKRRVALQMSIHLAEYNGLSMGCRVALLVAPGYTSPASAQVSVESALVSVLVRPTILAMKLSADAMALAVPPRFRPWGQELHGHTVPTIL